MAVPARKVLTAARSKYCAAILAGGKSSRMGENKALVEVNGKPMIAHVVEAVESITSRVMIISNAAETYSFLNHPVFPDAVASCGPLAGIYTALQHTKTTHCLVVACDLPFLEPPLLRFLCEHGSEVDVLAFESEDGVEPLCAVYSKACLRVVKRQIGSGQHKVSRLFSKLHTRLVSLQPGDAFYSEHAFLNVNTPDELEQARKLRHVDSKPNTSVEQK